MSSRRKPAVPAGKPAPWEALVAGITPRTKTLRLCLRGDLLSEVDRLTQELDDARTAVLNGNPFDNMQHVETLATQMLEAVAAARAAEVPFTFRSLGRTAWHQLIADHLPTEEQQRAGADFNPDTLPAVAMGLACLEPAGATVEHFEALAADENITDDQWNRLWATCHAAQTDSAEIPTPAAAIAVLARAARDAAAA